MRVILKPGGVLIVLAMLTILALVAYRGSVIARDATAKADAADPTAARVTAGDVELITSATKKDWLQDQIAQFNDVHKGRIQVKVKFIETREAYQAILNGKEKPVLWAPSSSFWATSLSDAWSKKGGRPLIDVSSPSSFRIYLRSPLVFLTTKKKAEALRPLLGGANAWGSLRDLNSGKQSVPWGNFKFAYADPLNANSGFMTLGLILTDYARQTGEQGQLNSVAQSANFTDYLKALHKKLVYDKAAEAGSSAMFKSFVEDPTRYDFISTYESNALGAAGKNPDLAVIYPSPTVVAEQTVAALTGGDWVTPEKKAAAAAFMAFLAEQNSLQDGVKSHFRPAQETKAVSLIPEIQKLAGQGFQQSFTAAEFPPYEAVNEAAFRWRENVAGKKPENLPATATPSGH